MSTNKGNSDLTRSPRPRVCIVGQLLGRNHGYITTQGQILADLFAMDGFEVRSVSSKLNRVLRLADVVWSVFRSRKKIDLMLIDVYSGLSLVMADTASLLSRFLGIPAIYILRGGNLPEFTAKYPGWLVRFLRRADILVAPSAFLAAEMAAYGFKVRIIPNVVALGRYNYRKRNKIGPKLLWMRSFHPIYNPGMAIEIFARVKESHPDATLVMAGVDKGLEAEMKNLVRDLGLQNSVRFPGFLDPAAKAREFSEAEIYLNTNLVDNMPVSVVEACAAGALVVATDVGGMAHLITHEENGLLVPPGDVDAAVEAVERLLRDPELAERLSKNGRLLAKRSDWLNVRGMWIELFDEVLCSGRRSLCERSNLALPDESF